VTTNKRPHPHAKEEFFSRVLPYEISMFRATYALARAPRPEAENRALVESFLLHARNLIEFFKDKPSCDFDPRMFTVASYQLDKDFIADAVLPRINAQISHLTVRRISSDAAKLGPRDWALIVRALDGEINRFRNALAADYRAVWPADSPAAATTAARPVPISEPRNLLRRANHTPANRDPTHVSES
jgi:hypothetical protein